MNSLPLLRTEYREPASKDELTARHALLDNLDYHLKEAINTEDWVKNYVKMHNKSSGAKRIIESLSPFLATYLLRQLKKGGELPPVAFASDRKFETDGKKATITQSYKGKKIQVSFPVTEELRRQCQKHFDHKFQHAKLLGQYTENYS